jgi:hypothetical protein
MIEPPSDIGRTGVLEVDDSVFVSVKLLFVKERACAVDESRKFELHVTPNPFAVKTREQGGRRSSIKTLVVIKDPNSQ